MPKVLFLDIETSPALAYVWGLFDQNVGLNQIKQDWFILSWSAKWKGSKEIFYQDQRKAKNIEDDKTLLKGIWQLIDEADVLVTQNGKRFDVKKLNARFILNGYQPPSGFRHYDTLQAAKSVFGFTSNKLEYMTDKLCKIKKSKHGKFAGFELWSECLKGNLEAWKEMEKYNKQDVLALEELYGKLAPWYSKINWTVYEPELENVCSCGCKRFHRNGYTLTNSGKYIRYKCCECGAEKRDAENLIDKPSRKRLMR